jgi:splicing factor 3A subunit 2
MYRFMSAFEQKVDAPNKDYQYLLIAAEPYQTIACKIPSRPIEEAEGTSWSYVRLWRGQ